MTTMGRETGGALAHAAELERRDEAIADELATVRRLEERVAALRARAAEVATALARIPVELEDLGRSRLDAVDAATAARVELDEAAARVTALESSRRPRSDELDRARKEAATARDGLADALARVERLEDLERQRRDDGRTLLLEERELVREAEEITTVQRAVARIRETAAVPGTTLAELDDWGGRVRSALLVARGTLETERERIVLEANVLGASVLGDQLGGSSVALVRRRLEAHLA